MKVNVDNIGVIAFAILLPIWAAVFLYHQCNYKPDEDLSNRQRQKQIEENFEKEFQEINLPPQTAVNNFENISKRGSGILLITKYRTELNSEDFIRHFNQELTRKGWIYYEKEAEGAFLDYKYCREKFDATLSWERSKGIWSDGANYFHLSFSLGFRARELFKENPIPESCR